MATVPDPPDVCFKKYVFDQCSRSAAVATCSLCGPSARHLHYFIFSAVISCDKNSVDTNRISDIARDCVLQLFLYCTLVMLTRCVLHWTIFAATKVFPPGFPVPNDDALDNLFLNFFTCSMKNVYIRKWCA